jgi:aminoglycoside 6-adenylyltransferase
MGWLRSLLQPTARLTVGARNNAGDEGQGRLMRTEDQVLAQFREWADNNALVRAAVLTSSRVMPGAHTDFLSDYDIELYVSDLNEFKKGDDWLGAFGPVMVRWPFRPRSTTGNDDWITRLVLFKDGVRIDFQITSELRIEPNAYDNGYQVLIDKDGLTRGLAAPTYAEYRITKPSAEEYQVLVHEFWWDACYVPKYLWRDELPFAKYMLDYILRYSFLHRLIDWHIGLQHNWTVETGVCGKKFKRYLDAGTWSEYEATCAGAGIEDNWAAFFKMASLFRRLARQVGANLGYEYPDELDSKVMQFCTKIRETRVD